MNRAEFSQLSAAILEYVAAHPGASTAEIRIQVGQHHPGKWPNNRVHNLAKNGRLANKNAGAPGRTASWYTSAAWNAMAAKAKSTSQLTVAARRGPVKWVPLPTQRSDIARADGQIAFRDCKSRTGDSLSDYVGPRPLCVAPGLGIYGPGRAGSAARW